MAAKKKIIEESPLAVSSGTYNLLTDKAVLIGMSVSEIIDSALVTAKSFAKNFTPSFIPSGNNEIDEYITSMDDESDDSTISIDDFRDQLLDYIIPGCAGSRVVWAEDEQGLQFPRMSYGFDKSFIRVDQNGNLFEKTSGQELEIDQDRIYIIRDVLNMKNAYGKGKEQILTPLMRHLLDFYDNMSVTGKKYKNPGKIMDIKRNANDTINTKNIKTVGDSARNLDKGSLVVTNDLEKFVILPTGKVTDLMDIIGSLERKIVRTVVGHEDALDSLKYGSGSKMEVVINIIKYLAKTRCKKVAVQENKLFRNTVDIRWGTTFPAPVKVYDYEDDASSEDLFKWYQAGIPVRSSRVYSKLGGKPSDKDVIQKELTVKDKVIE